MRRTYSRCTKQSAMTWIDTDESVAQLEQDLEQATAEYDHYNKFVFVLPI